MVMLAAAEESRGSESFFNGVFFLLFSYWAFGPLISEKEFQSPFCKHFPFFVFFFLHFFTRFFARTNRPKYFMITY